MTRRIKKDGIKVTKTGTKETGSRLDIKNLARLRKGHTAQRINENHDKPNEAKDRRMKYQEEAEAKPADNRQQEGRLVDMVYIDSTRKEDCNLHYRRETGGGSIRRREAIC